jgi:alpha-amylase/alpha-mannosidase (GH57 family)
MTRLALLWHMHQPYYEDLSTGEHILPWVRLHAIKDYAGMVSVLREFPTVRATFNLVPSLLVQVQAFAEERASDRHLDVGLRPADALDADDRQFLIANGFHAPVTRMIRPYPRYAELHALRNTPAAYTTQDLRDLQVWQKLAWMDPDWLLKDRRLAALVRQQRDFDEADKTTLREVELELLAGVIPAYRDAARSGQIELSTSPYYHPILPLLCDTDTHLEGHPHSALPRGLFHRPDDARAQLERAVALHARLFDSRPRGVWPSEGSVSDEVLGLLADAGFAWTATDEEILARSLGRALTAAELYKPYQTGRGDRTIRCLFRDHGLSDLIGFAYQSWDPDTAADDFVSKVADAGQRFAAATGEDAVVTVILDGENAWEHYAGGGRPFLRALYARLAAAADVETVTMSQAALAPAGTLAHVFPGSWINGDFYIWAGHPDDQRAWGQLAAARAAYDEAAGAISPEARARAYEELLVAEGSDWFWWYGDDHSSDHDHAFDDLFRRQLRNVYRALGRRVPDDLHVSNITTAPAAAAGEVRVTTFVEPAIDGEVSHFGEWSGAASVALRGGGGTMHRVAGAMVRELRVGVGRTDLFIRVDAPEFLRRAAAEGLELVLLVDRPRRLRLTLSGATVDASRVRSAAGSVIEAAIPFRVLGAQAGDRLRFSVLIADAAGQMVEQHPALQPIEIDAPTRHLAAVNWSV